MIYILLLFFILSVILTWAYKQYAIRLGIVDNPNARSLHSVPTPRGGGIVFISLWVIFLICFTYLGYWPWQQTLALLPAVIAIGFIGFIDDKITLSAKWRFIVHIAAAAYFLLAINGLSQVDFGFFTLHSSWFFSILAFVFLVWSTNLFNFMDGSDGFAASEAIFIFLAGGCLLMLNYQASNLAYLCFALVAVIAGFLVWNWPKAKIFMGDVGSTCLGFLIVAIAILAQKQANMPILLWAMLYGLFIFDATITLLRRVLHGENWRESHRSHAYQRLAQSGWSHLRIVVAAMVCNLAIVGLVIFASLLPQLILLFLGIEFCILALIYYRIEKIYPMLKKNDF